MNTAFVSSKIARAGATLLSHPMPDAEISLTSDASDNAVGAVLEQRVNRSWQPLAFFSKHLRPRETKCSTFDRELLGLYLAIRHFQVLYRRQKLHIIHRPQDHKPLVGAMSKMSDPWTARQQRQLAYIFEFSTDIRHIAGKTNVVAECLSRPASAIELTNVTLGIDYAAMATAQTQDPDCRASRTAITGLKVVLISIQGSEQQLLCDTSTGQPRPLVPRDFQRQVFDTIHSLAHPGRKSTVKLVTQTFVWHGLKKQVSQWAKECLPCQQSKNTNAYTCTCVKDNCTHKRFTHIHIDLVGPLPPSDGYSYLLIIIDRTTRWSEAIPFNHTSFSECAETLI